MPEKNFTTSDYGLANWLVFNRVTLIGTVEFPGETIKQFVFITEPRIDSLVEEWGPPLSMPASEPAKTCKRFFQAHSIVKKALKDSLNVHDA